MTKRTHSRFVQLTVDFTLTQIPHDRREKGYTSKRGDKDC